MVYVRTLLRNMNNQDYQKLLQYLKKLTSWKKDYERWITQFGEQNDHIYQENRKVVSVYKMKWIMLIFHDDPTQAY